MSLRNDNLEKESTARFERHMEKRCAKLREEILLFQASSLKEHANLCKKLELETRGKRELSRQLAIAHKETRTAKQDLEELMTEKVNLMKKLEAATSEFKINMKTKKNALAELEEALNKIDSLTEELDIATKEKHEIEDKAKRFREKYEKLKQRQKLYEGDNFSELTKYKNSLLRAIFDEKEHAVDKVADFDDDDNFGSVCDVPRHKSKHSKPKLKK